MPPSPVISHLFPHLETSMSVKNQRPSSTRANQFNDSDSSFKAKKVRNDKQVGEFGGALSNQPDNNSRPRYVPKSETTA